MTTRVMRSSAPRPSIGPRAAALGLLALLLAFAALGGIMRSAQVTQPAPAVVERPAAPDLVQPADPRPPSVSQPSFEDRAPVAPAVVPQPGPVLGSTPAQPVTPQQNVMTVAPDDRAPSGGVPPQRNVMSVAPEDGVSVDSIPGASK